MKFKTYPSYKDSGVEWLGEVPEGWNVIQLKRVINSVKTGGTPSNLNDEHLDDNGFHWFTPGDFNEDLYLNNSNRTLSKIGKSEVKIFAPQTIMMVGIGATIGKVAISKSESSCNQQINAITCSKSILPSYCAYYLKANRDYIVNLYGKYTTLPIINQDDTKSIITVLPSIAEQTSIANFLDRETHRIDALVEEKNHFIELLKEKRQALISHVVTKGLDPTVKMKDSGVEWLGEVPEHWAISALKHKIRLRYGDPLASEIREDGEIEVFGSNGSVGFHNIANTKTPAIVVGRKGSYGKIVWAEKGGFVIDTAYSIDADTTSLNLRWVYYVLQPLGLDSLSQDTGVPGLSRESAYGIRIAVPQLSEQTAIANFLDRQTTKIDALITETQNSIALLKEHRTALISAAVTGKIDVREVA